MLRHEPADHQADAEGHTEDGPDLTLHLALHPGLLALLIDERGAIERLHLVRDADGRFPLRHEAAQQRPCFDRPAAAVGRQDFIRRESEFTNLRAQPIDALPFRGRVEERHVPPERRVNRRVGPLDAPSMLGLGGRVRVEQRVSQQHRGFEYLRTHRRE